MSSCESTAEITKIEKNQPAPNAGFLMEKSDYQVILDRAMKYETAEFQLQQCLNEEPAIESDHSLEWTGVGFVMGMLSTGALLYYLK